MSLEFTFAFNPPCKNHPWVFILFISLKNNQNYFLFKCWCMKTVRSSSLYNMAVIQTSVSPLTPRIPSRVWPALSFLIGLLNNSQLYLFYIFIYSNLEVSLKNVQYMFFWSLKSPNFCFQYLG